MCFVRLVNDVPGSVYAKLRDPPLVFSNSLCCFLMIMVHAVSNMWLPLRNGWVFAVCLRCVCMVYEG